MLRFWDDPQHGGSSKGTEHDGFVERVWNVGMSQSLAPIYGAFGCEHQVSRLEDVTISYEDRAEGARDWEADFAILHHVNAMVYPKAYPKGHELAGQPHPLAGEPWIRFDGLMTFAIPEDYAGMQVAKMIGDCSPFELRQRIPTYPATPNDWTRRAYNCLLPYSKRGIPATLIEWGFATSPNDRAFLQSPKNRPSLLATAAAGIGRAHEVLRW